MSDVLAEALAAELASRYVIEGELGRGSSATVYLARDLRHGRRVALKLLHAQLGEALGAQSISGNPSPLLAVVPIYWSLLLPLTWIARRLERRLATSETWIASRTSS